MKMKYDFKEIFKLKDMLDKAGIEYEFLDHTTNIGNMGEWTSYQICCPCSDLKRQYISIIQSFGSHGRDDDLLEIMGLLTPEEAEEDGVAGWLTAQDVFDRIQDYLKGGK